MRKLLYPLFLIFIISCNEAKKEKISFLVNEWMGKEILYPNDMIFTLWGKDTIKRTLPHASFSIVTYADSIGCISCKLQLLKWKSFITKLDSVSLEKIPVYFFLYPKDLKEIIHTLKRDYFNYPVCVDMKNAFNKLNHFPDEIDFQTFLVDKNNKVVAIGNPVHNFKVKELYLNIIQGKNISIKRKEIKTKVDIKDKSMFLGKFNWQQEQKAVFTLTNTGTNPLVINHVNTSCGCTSVDYSKEPVRSGDSLLLHVTYKADYPEHFDKTISVYCNAKPSPVVLKITGDAE